jgi:hypothetical protein
MATPTIAAAPTRSDHFGAKNVFANFAALQSANQRVRRLH